MDAQVRLARSFSVIVTTLVIACGPASAPAAVSSSAPVPSSTTSSTPAPTPAATPTPTPGMPLGVSACDLFNWADMGSLVSGPSPEPILTKFDLASNDALKGTRCDYRAVTTAGQTPTSAGDLSLTFNCCFDAAKFDAWVRQFAGADTARPGRDITPVSGVGDRAYLTGFECIVNEGTRPFEIFFQKGPYGFKLSLSRIAAWEGTNGNCRVGASRLPGPVFISQAKTILGRLSSAAVSTPTPVPTVAVTAAPAAASGACATPPAMTLPPAFVFTGCRQSGPGVSFTYGATGGASISLSVLPGGSVASPPGATPIDINGQTGSIASPNPGIYILVWSRGTTNYAVSTVGISQEAVVAFARSVR